MINLIVIRNLIKKIFDYFIWAAFFIFLILGVIIYITDRTYPKDALYPYKLKFEGFVLAASKVLNKQVDFSIDLVMKRSDETTKTLVTNTVSPDYVQDALDRLNSQVTLTSDSINQILDPVQKKQAAVKYIAKLDEVSSTLSENQKEFTSNNSTSQTDIQVSQNTEASTVSQQIDNTQQTIQQTIKEMTNLTNNTLATPTPEPTIAPTDIPTPTNVPTLTVAPTLAPTIINPANYNNNNSDKNKKNED